VMTRTTLKALWFGGGGIVATWLAVSPNTGVARVSPPSTVQHPSAPDAFEELSAQSTRLRERRAAATPNESTRNPFRFKSSKPLTPPEPQRERQIPAHVESPLPVAPPPPPLTLSGVAQKSGKRSAIITGAGQLYIVGEGETVAGRYAVVKVDPEAVVLRDADGAEQRLALPR
jgi:hypothetical protein